MMQAAGAHRREGEPEPEQPRDPGEHRPAARVRSRAFACPMSPSAVRLLMSGEDEISTFKEGSEQYPVTMRLMPGSARRSGRAQPACWCLRPSRA